jgi:hypothetical protein
MRDVTTDKESLSQGTYGHCGEKEGGDDAYYSGSLTVMSLQKAMQETFANLQQTNSLPSYR